MKIHKLTKNIILTVLTLVSCTILLYGCNSTPNYANIEKYHAALYDPKWDWFNVSFISNATLSTYVVKDQGRFDEMFKEFPVAVDFENQILLVHWETSQIGHPYQLKDVYIVNNTAYIKYGCTTADDNVFGSHNTSPHQKFIAVVMDRADISEAQFIYKK